MKKCIFIVIFLAVSSPVFGEDFSAKVRKPVRESIHIRQQTQKAEDNWYIEKEKLTAQYDALVQENERLVSKNRDLITRVNETTQRIHLLNDEIQGISDITSGLHPFLNNTYQRIVSLFESNPHFLPKERKQRITRLDDILHDSEATDSEKYRKLMETIFIEAEYGNTIEVYQERITMDDKEMMADIFRLGRLSLFCQSPDQKVAGYFNVAESRWEVLPKKYNPSIQDAIGIGSKRRPADIINLPLGRIAVK